MKNIKLAVIQSIFYIIVFTLIFSLKANLMVSFLSSLVIAAAVIITNFLLNKNNKYLEVASIIIATSAMTITHQFVFKGLSIVVVICYLTVAIISHRTSKNVVSNHESKA